MAIEQAAATHKNTKYVAAVHYCEKELRDDFGDIRFKRNCGKFTFMARETKEDALEQAIYWAKVHSMVGGTERAEITVQLAISSDCILSSWRYIDHERKWTEGKLLALKAGKREDLIKELDSYRSKYSDSWGNVSCMAQDVLSRPNAGGVSYSQIGTFVVAKILRKKEKSVIKQYKLRSGSFITNQSQKQTNQQNVPTPGSGNPINTNNQGENNSTNPLNIFGNTNNRINQTTNEIDRTRRTVEGLINIFR
ncbi:hypothetical protein VB715_00620 [Crocosphaera sp. UHCC 0190]|uniref:hypothetical protein n=1 Tax=Crocosphaera sp. UHCC 0190 TaxID=3110246 RepID=UPI002B1F7C7B|nr:hypothetical protein [Crocosphaera sp. UHCC 0190]MEA5508258.1 hypothetical protein [Crocosphaera sp. UHCC 0190]